MTLHERELDLIDIDMGVRIAGRKQGFDEMIKLERVYEEETPADGVRYLIERLWPRGVRKESLHIEAWLKDAGPSTELRKWFNHDPEKWSEFRRRYFAELNQRKEAWAPILEAAERGTVTLLYSSHDTEHNNAVALKEYIEGKMAAPSHNARQTRQETAGNGIQARHSHRAGRTK